MLAFREWLLNETVNYIGPFRVVAIDLWIKILTAEHRMDANTPGWGNFAIKIVRHGNLFCNYDLQLNRRFPRDPKDPSDMGRYNIAIRKANREDQDTSPITEDWNNLIDETLIAVETFIRFVDPSPIADKLREANDSWYAIHHVEPSQIPSWGGGRTFRRQ